MPYDDDDDLFDHEFDFVDDDDDDVKGKSKGDDESKPPRRVGGRGRKPKADGGEKPAEKPASRGPKRAGPSRPRRDARRDAPEAKPKPAPPADLEPAPVGYIMDDAGFEEEDEPAAIEPEAAASVPEAAPESSGPPADHVVHIYEYGQFKRTIPRKFTDEQAVSFAEEFTRTGKAYGRYAVATPDDEEPAPTFAGVGRG
jgi:hypothetical protein